MHKRLDQVLAKGVVSVLLGSTITLIAFGRSHKVFAMNCFQAICTIGSGSNHWLEPEIMKHIYYLFTIFGRGWNVLFPKLPKYHLIYCYLLIQVYYCHVNSDSVKSLFSIIQVKHPHVNIIKLESVVLQLKVQIKIVKRLQQGKLGRQEYIINYKGSVQESEYSRDETIQWWRGENAGVRTVLDCTTTLDNQSRCQTKLSCVLILSMVHLQKMVCVFWDIPNLTRGNKDIIVLSWPYGERDWSRTNCWWYLCHALHQFYFSTMPTAACTPGFLK